MIAVVFDGSGEERVLGDKGSPQRCKSWRVVSPTDMHEVSPCTKMWFMHFASLMEGGKLALLDPVNKENSFVQNSVARGLPR